SAEVLKTAEQNVEETEKQANEERARGGCGTICHQREADEKAARAALLEAQNNRAATIKAADLDGKIDAAQRDVDDNSRHRTAAKDADPQAKSIAKAFGISEDVVALLGYVIFAIGVEIGSGLLPWLLFGHGRPEEKPAPEATKSEPHPTPLETPESIRKMFFD